VHRQSTLTLVNESYVIGNKVREARKRRGLTQRELSRLSGVSVSLITKLEQGEYGGIRLETCWAIEAELMPKPVARTTAIMAALSPSPRA